MRTFPPQTHLAALRAMTLPMAPTLGAPSIPAVDEAEQLRLELYEACRARTRGWVERRIHSRVASFHLHWHDDCGGRDLLAVDATLSSAHALLDAALGELGALPVVEEVLAECETRLASQLERLVRRANRHELRMLHADFFALDGPRRERLRQICLSKYLEQITKHVHSEASLTLFPPYFAPHFSSLHTAIPFPISRAGNRCAGQTVRDAE